MLTGLKVPMHDELTGPVPLGPLVRVPDGGSWRGVVELNNFPDR